MTNVATLQAKLHKGYGKAARKLGANYSFYRGAVAQAGLTDQAGNPLEGQDGAVLEPQNPSGLLLDQNGVPLQAQDGSYVQDQGTGAAEVLTDQSGRPLLDQAGDPLLAKSGPGEPLVDQNGQPLLDQAGNPLLSQAVTTPVTPGASPMLSVPYGSGMVSFNAEDMGYRKPSKYGKATWYAVFDGTNAAVGDYIVGPQGTFFIAAMQPLLPILAVECNRTISVSTPQDQGGAGAQPYGGSTEANRSVVMTGWPASVLAGTKGEKTEANLPDDTRAPWWTILLPYLDGVVIEFGHQVEDDLGRSYTVSSAELTGFGWKISARLNVT